MNWVPRKLAPQIRCVFSMIDGTPQHLALSQREPEPYVVNLNPLTEENRKVNVNGATKDRRHLALIFCGGFGPLG